MPARKKPVKRAAKGAKKGHCKITKLLKALWHEHAKGCPHCKKKLNACKPDCKECRLCWHKKVK